MKIAMINDTHFGARNDHQLFLDYFLRFFERDFFPYLKEHKIDTIFHLGDFFDRRKYINFYTLNQVKQKFLNVLVENNIKMYMLIGNHDTYYKNTNDLNSIDQILSEYSDNIIYSKDPVDRVFGSVNFCFIPWICDDNRDKVLAHVMNTNADVLCGHLELNGYEVMRGVKHIGGMDDDVFEKFNIVLTGHFHNKSSKKNIKYLGTQYEITYSDLEDMKGFHVFDTDTESIEFIENPERMFYVISTEDNYDDYSFVADKYVKILVSRNTDRKMADRIINTIESYNPYEMNVIEDFSLDDLEKKAVDLSKDTITIINEEIDDLDLDIDKNFLKKISNEIYLEALDQ
jgi:DNA repair exonuclease SbcCD nuclease subunit